MEAKQLDVVAAAASVGKRRAWGKENDGYEELPQTAMWGIKTKI